MACHGIVNISFPTYGLLSSLHIIYTKMMEEFKKKGVNVLNWYWTLGRYDTVFIFEAASEKEALKMSVDISEWVATETLVAMPRQEVAELL